MHMRAISIIEFEIGYWNSLHRTCWYFLFVLAVGRMKSQSGKIVYAKKLHISKIQLYE